MDHKLGPTILSRDDLELLCLEVAKIIETLHEQSLIKGKTTTAPALVLSSGLLDVLARKPSDPAPAFPELQKVQLWLEEVKTSAPEIRLTLPALPAVPLKSDIVAWFRDNIHPLAIFKFEYNRAIAGGFVIRTGSVIHDFSFRKALLTNSGAMVKVMKQYMREKPADV